MEHYKRLLDAGYDYIELSGKVVCAMSPQEFSAAERAVRDGPLPCKGLVAYCPPTVIIAGPGYTASAARAYAQTCAERAARLGAGRVGIGSPLSRTLPDGYDRELAFQQAVEFFAVTCGAFSEYGIDVCVEPLGYCFCNFINTLKEGADLQKAVGAPNMKMILDFYNMEKAHEPETDIAEYLPLVAGVHMSDDAGSPWRRWFLKEDRAAIHRQRVRKLAALGYKGDLSIEIDLPVDTDAARQSLSIVKQAVADEHSGLLGGNNQWQSANRGKS